MVANPVGLPGSGRARRRGGRDDIICCGCSHLPSTSAVADDEPADGARLRQPMCSRLPSSYTCQIKYWAKLYGEEQPLGIVLGRSPGDQCWRMRLLTDLINRNGSLPGTPLHEALRRTNGKVIAFRQNEVQDPVDTCYQPAQAWYLTRLWCIMLSLEPLVQYRCILVPLPCFPQFSLLVSLLASLSVPPCFLFYFPSLVLSLVSLPSFLPCFPPHPPCLHTSLLPSLGSHPSCIPCFPPLLPALVVLLCVPLSSPPCFPPLFAVLFPPSVSSIVSLLVSLRVPLHGLLFTAWVLQWGAKLLDHTG